MASPAFALLCCGRLVQTDYQQMDESRIAFTVKNIDSVKHLSVFMTGSIALPEGIGAAVYLIWLEPNSTTSSTNYLGYVANDKPSALFQISRFRTPMGSMVSTASPFALNHAQVASSTDAHIGISLEPLSTIVQYAADPGYSPEEVAFSTFAAESLFNYVSSFAKQVTGDFNGGAVVPLSAIQSWYTRFLERIRVDPNFWRK